ncbi:MAG: orotate phosphoribosyltransferase [Candidatus Acididesulfobacter guangdongensis]|uniref:Orotate phosphoribosyltransferase n=1 Tax=Acididesulfobacter guangdongensis TaxID=2597225 RepID=A0A519BEV9_ACIG2|nr:MAG: orotate phosphoribosyltransferase [Candidatus Acididesulfobacter guangdongensis]
MDKNNSFDSNILNVNSGEIRLKVLNAIKTLCYEKKEFTLVSGRKSDFYIDLRRISFDGDYLYYIGKLLYGELTALNGRMPYDVIAGVPVGGLPLVASILIASFLDNNPLKSVVIRKERKGYGKGNMIEPVQFLGKDAKIVIIEDVVTTGGSILNAVNNARNEGYIINSAVCIVDREEGGKENLLENGISLVSLFTRADILLPQ